MNQKRILFARNKNLLPLAVASCFGLVAGQAHATLDLVVSSPTGATKFAKEIPSNTATLVNTGNNFAVKVAVPTGYKVAAATTPLFVKFNLTNGAKFGAAPTLTCTTAAGTVDSTAAGDVAGGTLTNGASTNAITFTVADMQATSNGLSGHCYLAGGDITISGLGDVAVSATVEYKLGLSSIVTGVSNNFITYVRGATATVVSADGSVVVDATSGSDNFTSGSNKNSQTLALLGVVSFDQVGTSAAVAAAGNANIAVAAILSTASVTVNGAAIAAALVTNGNSGIFLDVASGCTTRSYTVSASATNSVTFNNVALTDLTPVGDGVYVCINVSGTTQTIGTGQFTASVGGVTQSNVTADFSTTSSAMETITSNGQTRNAYFVNASTSAAKTSILRVINTGAATAAFTATAYTVDTGAGDGAAVAATQLGTVNSALGTLVPGGALSLTSAQLESKLGFTPSASTSKYRVVISAGTNAIEVLNYTKDTATGAIVLSQSQTN